MPEKREWKQLEHERRERLFRGRTVYDRVRPLFDLPNQSPIPPQYKPSDMELRPHLRDRIIEGEFEVQTQDRVYLRGFGAEPILVSELFGSTAVVMITLFPDNDNTGNPGNINIRLKRNAQEDAPFIGSLRPDGEVKGLWNDTYEVEQALSLFALTVKVLDDKRLRPLS